MMDNDTDVYSGFEVAVIGMAGRFPGARNIREYWQNLKKELKVSVFFQKKNSWLPVIILNK